MRLLNKGSKNIGCDIGFKNLKRNIRLITNSNNSTCIQIVPNNMASKIFDRMV